MNDNLTALLEKLSSKLGVTTEYLWKVLLVQARISAVQSLLFIAGVIIVGIVLYRLHNRFSKVIPNNRYKDNVYENNEALCMIMIIVTCTWSIMVICACFFSFSNAIDGLVNPEYWALNEILSKI